jgi:hypothetical protein
MGKKVAFIALTNSSFLKDGLMQKFFCQEHSDKYNLYIHNKNPISNDYFKRFEISNDYKVETEWGKYPLVLATVRLLMVALQDPENEKFVLISESHCPLYSIDKICSIIFDRYPILSFSNQPKEASWSLSRFNALIRDKNRNPFDPNNAKFVSQWFVCGRSDAEIFVKHEIKLRKYFNINKLCFPDELYFHLIARHFNVPLQYKNSCHFNWNLKSAKHLIDAGFREKPKTYCKISNRTIDVFREKSDCIFLRKVYDGTILDEDYLLQ